MSCLPPNPKPPPHPTQFISEALPVGLSWPPASPALAGARTCRLLLPTSRTPDSSRSQADEGPTDRP